MGGTLELPFISIAGLSTLTRQGLVLVTETVTKQSALYVHLYASAGMANVLGCMVPHPVNAAAAIPAQSKPIIRIIVLPLDELKQPAPAAGAFPSR